MNQDIERVLLDETSIRDRIARVAREVTETYRGERFTVVAVLKGSCVFVADLMRQIPIPLELAFVAASSYGDRTRSGPLDVSFFPADGEIRGRSLLLVDDILDTGKTLEALRQECLQRGAAKVRTCVFLDKPERRRVPIEPDFRCFDIEDVFVVGFGLDYAGRYRNLPYVGTLRPEVYSQPAGAVADPE